MMTRRIWIAAILVGFVAACNGRHSAPIPDGALSSQSNHAAFATTTATPSTTPTPEPSPAQTAIPATLKGMYVVDNSGATSGPHAKHQPLYNAILKAEGGIMHCLVGTATPVPAVGKVAGGGLGCLYTPLPGPRGVAVDINGAAWIADQRANVIYSVKKFTHTAVILGSGCPTTCFYNSPYGVAVDASPQPNVYFTGHNSSGFAVFEYSTATSSYQTLTPPAIGWGTLGGVALDQSENVYVSDSSNGTIWKVPAGAGTPTPLVPTGTFASNYGVAVDLSGNVYVADTNNDAVKEIVFSAGGQATVQCVPNRIPMSSCNSINGGAGGAGFLKPHGVAVDAHGNVYVADSNHSAVKLVTPQGIIKCLTPGAPSQVKCNGTNFGPGVAGFFLPNAVAPYPLPTPTASP